HLEFLGWQSEASIQSFIDRIKDQLPNDESKQMVDTPIPPETVSMLHKRLTVDEDWEDGVQWANGASDKLRGYDAEAEEGRHWTPEWERRWCRFFNSKLCMGKVDRVQWSKAEWRFFVETCQSRSLVTGQHLEGKDAQIDRIFNNDNYTVQNCILIEQGLNFAKRTMSEFQTSNTFDGHCKFAHGVSTLRAAVKKVLDKSRAH
ncbi:hypothetical protein BGX27_010877, partial [Mortierella sp. AM989]